MTQVGRAFAYVLMIGGIWLFGALTDNFASILVRSDVRNALAIEALTEQVRSIWEELVQLSEQPPAE